MCVGYAIRNEGCVLCSTYLVSTSFLNDFQPFPICLFNRTVVKPDEPNQHKKCIQCFNKSFHKTEFLFLLPMILFEKSGICFM